MHLSVDSTLSLAELRVSLPRALASLGLGIDRISDIPARGFVVELVDPLPAVEAEDPADPGARSTWKVAVYARTGGGSRLSTVRPTHLVDLMDRPGAAAPALAFEGALERALLSAAGRPDAGRPS